MSNEAESAIRRAIRDRGPITFAEFMELALYGTGGYYHGNSPINASGDYFTSPAAHPLFGALVAAQLQEMWHMIGEPKEFVVVEQGAGNGGLAADISEAAAGLQSEFINALKYRAFDIVPAAQQHYPVEPVTDAPRGAKGCVLSNELLDAMPVHRVEARGGEALEIFVAVDDDNGGFVEVLQEPSTPLIQQRIGPFLNDLPDGYRGEVCAGIDPWAEQQAQTLERGWVLTIDYGFDRPALYRPERAEGSLRCYYQHTLGQDPLAHAGRQDITAHVDFTAVDEAMKRTGFESAGTTTQAEFLQRLGFDSAVRRFDERTLPRPELRANIAGTNALIDPEGMGSFVVKCHAKNVPATPLSGVSPEGSMRFTGAPPQLNPARHINLLAQQQSGSSYFEVESLEDLFRD